MHRSGSVAPCSLDNKLAQLHTTSPAQAPKLEAKHGAVALLSVTPALTCSFVALHTSEVALLVIVVTSLLNIDDEAAK